MCQINTLHANSETISLNEAPPGAEHMSSAADPSARTRNLDAPKKPVHVALLVCGVRRGLVGVDEVGWSAAKVSAERCGACGAILALRGREGPLRLKREAGGNERPGLADEISACGWIAGVGFVRTRCLR